MCQQHPRQIQRQRHTQRQIQRHRQERTSKKKSSCICIAYKLHIIHRRKAEDIVYHSVMTMTTTKTHTKTNTKTKTKTMTKTKCSKDPSHAIFLKSWEFKDIRYDAYNDKDNDQEKDNDKDKEKDKDKVKCKSSLDLLPSLILTARYSDWQFIQKGETTNTMVTVLEELCIRMIIVILKHCINKLYTITNI